MIREAAEAGLDRIQIREKDLGGLSLLRMARRVIAEVERTRTTVIINDRVDVALAASAAGVHLGRDSFPPDVARRIGGEELILGASTHTIDEALEAQDRGADYLFFGPVFATPSKAAYGEPVGLRKLEWVLRRIRIPVYAIGGIGPERLDELRPLPLAGVAMISAFVRAPSAARLVREVHAIGWR